MAKPICRLTSTDASVTFVPANGEGPCVDLSASGGMVGPGTATEVAFFTGPTTVGSDPDFFWDNVGKGLQLGPVTSFPGSRLTVNAPSAQILYVMQKTTAPLDFFVVSTSTGDPAALAPIFFGHLNAATSSADTALYFLGSISPANDNPGDEAVIWFAARRGNSSGGAPAVVINRPLFKWLNYVTEEMRMQPNGYLGVNQVAPAARIHTSNSSAIDPGLIVDGGSFFGLGPIALFRKTSGATVVLGVVATGATGRVGIGTVAAAPTELLDVAGGKSKFDNGANAAWNVSILAADPAAPVDGDCWFTNAAGIRRWNVRIAGVSYSVVMV